MGQEPLTSVSFPDGLPPLRTEAAVRAKRAAMEARMREEGTPEHMITRLATDETAAKMLAYEDQCVGAIFRMIGGRV